ncbi:MAG: 30S ribosomal protein S18 [Lentisphaerae bacterium]|nr:30S ribosomal protein S18 [Lentisphaerota bacterium]
MARNIDSGARRSRRVGKVKDLDSHNYELLRRFMTDHGKLLPARITGISAKQQRTVKQYIRRARVMGLLP